MKGILRMQKEIRIDLERLAETYGIELDEAVIEGLIQEAGWVGPGSTLILIGRPLE